MSLPWKVRLLPPLPRASGAAVHVDQWKESLAREARQCRFESCRGHQEAVILRMPASFRSIGSVEDDGADLLRNPGGSNLMTDSHGRRSSAVEHFRNRSPGGNARRARALRPHPSSVRGSIEDGYQPYKLGVAGSSPAVFHYFRAGPLLSSTPADAHQGSLIEGHRRAQGCLHGSDGHRRRARHGPQWRWASAAGGPQRSE